MRGGGLLAGAVPGSPGSFASVQVLSDGIGNTVFGGPAPSVGRRFCDQISADVLGARVTAEGDGAGLVNDDAFHENLPVNSDKWQVFAEKGHLYKIYFL
ncbi:hypothetical protein GCM10017559_54090 [Streptosporangium longisporum]|uniref:Uncharacterized protein n=1 Tax=Streptosporangium longisporum TaxID=46187 RepID=A0ABN3Y806_9ACTN